MERLILTCKCGGSMRVPALAMGEEGYCIHCGAKIRVRTSNTEPEIPYEDDADFSAPVDVDSEAALDSENEVNLFFEEQAPETVPPADAKSMTQAERDVALFAAPEQAAATPSAPQAVGGTCARCGRPFRGDWDRLSTSKGTVCYICANILRTEEGEAIAELEEGKAPPVDPALGQSWDRLEAETESARIEARHQDDKRVRHRQMAALAAIFAIIAVAILVWPAGEMPSENTRGRDATRDSTPTETSAPTEALEEAPQWTRPVLGTIRLGTRLLGVILALYLTLNVRNKLPNETFGKNLLAVSLVGILIFIIQLALTPVFSLPILGPLVFIIVFFILLKVIYDFNLIDFIYYFVFGMVARYLVMAITTLLTGLLGLAVT